MNKAEAETLAAVHTHTHTHTHTLCLLEDKISISTYALLNIYISLSLFVLYKKVRS